MFPHAYIVMVMVGTAKVRTLSPVLRLSLSESLSLTRIVLLLLPQGAGSGILRTFEQLIRGVWVPSGNEILRPTFYTKACILASVVFALEVRRQIEYFTDVFVLLRS